MYRFKDMHVSNKITLILLFVVLFSLTGTGLYTFWSTSENVEYMLGRRLEHIARTAALMIDVDDHSAVVDAYLEEDENLTTSKAFKSIQSTLKKIQDKNDLTEDVYTLISPDWAADHMIFVTTSNDKPYVGNGLPINPIAQRVFATGQPNHTKLYEDNEGVWVSAFAPILDKEGKVAAIVEVDYRADKEVAAAKMTIVKNIGLPAVFSIFLALFLGNIVGRIITIPLAKLAAGAKEAASGKLDTRIINKNKDEIGFLARAFNKMLEDLQESHAQLEDYAKNLEKKVDERTAALKEANKDINNLLNNLGQGFMVINPDGVVQPGSSLAAHKFLGTDPTNKPFKDVLQLNEKAQSSLSEWMSLVFEQTIDFESLKPLGPGSFEKVNDRFIELDYRPIFCDDGKKLEKIICIAEDKTQERQLRAEAAQEREFSQMVVSIVRNRAGFVDFVHEVYNRLDQINASLSNESKDIDVEELFRDIHTIKGEAATFHTKELRDKSHVFENELANLKCDTLSDPQKARTEFKERVVDIRNTFDRLLEDNKELVGNVNDDGSREKMVPMEEINKFSDFLKNQMGEKSSTYDHYLQTFVLEDISESFAKYKMLALKVAESLGKEIEFKMDPSEIRVAIDPYKALISSCVHIFRNTVDHGIEVPEEREEAGKPLAGQVHLSFKPVQINGADADRFQIILQDDGKGINTDIIKEKALGNGLITEEQAKAMNEDQLAQLVFESGLSSRDAVTDLSGRGVGLDSVRYEAQKIGGRAWVESVQGKGCKFVIEVPVYATPGFTPLKSSGKIAA